jgi:hypothetical protein
MEAVFFGAWILLSIGVGAFADSKGRSLAGFLLLSLVISPLLGLVAVALVKNLKEEAAAAAASAREDARRMEELRALTAAARAPSPPPIAMPPTPTAMPTIAPLGSVADELSKLAELRDKGVLSNEEFNEQKTLVLDRQRSASRGNGA